MSWGNPPRVETEFCSLEVFVLFDREPKLTDQLINARQFGDLGSSRSGLDDEIGGDVSLGSNEAFMKR